ncbi:MAG: hypothetical protein LUF92_17190 [Clostridiales bacterium]|nr:hypothetical protein [Clostridiales bacterium]
MEYADVLGECLSNAIKNNVSGSMLPDGKMYYNIAKTISEPMLKKNYEKVVEQCAICQNNMNANAKLGLKAVKAKYNNERTEGIVKYISDAEMYKCIRTEKRLSYRRLSRIQGMLYLTV